MKKVLKLFLVLGLAIGFTQPLSANAEQVISVETSVEISDNEMENIIITKISENPIIVRIPRAAASYNFTMNCTTNGGCPGYMSGVIVGSGQTFSVYLQYTFRADNGNTYGVYSGYRYY